MIPFSFYRGCYDNSSAEKVDLEKENATVLIARP